MALSEGAEMGYRSLLGCGHELDLRLVELGDLGDLRVPSGTN